MMVENSDGNTEGFLVVFLEVVRLGQIELQCFVLLIIPHLEKSLVLNKVHHLVYLVIPLTL